MDATISSLSRTDLKSPKTSLPSSPTRIGQEEEFPHREERRQSGVLVLNRDGRILYLNGETQNIFDFRDQNVLSKSTENAPLQEIAFDFLSEFKQRNGFAGKSPHLLPPAPNKRTFLHRGTVYQIRSISLAPHGKRRRDAYLLLLIEKSVRDPRADSLDRPIADATVRAYRRGGEIHAQAFFNNEDGSRCNSSRQLQRRLAQRTPLRDAPHRG